jgi:hypothetical protein
MHAMVTRTQSLLCHAEPYATVDRTGQPIPYWRSDRLKSLYCLPLLFLHCLIVPTRVTAHFRLLLTNQYEALGL